MKRIVFMAIVTTSALILGAMPAFAQRLRGVVTMSYGTTSSVFSLSSASFTTPYQQNTSADFVINGGVEYLVVRRWPLELGVQAQGTFAVSDWNLGAPGVTDGAGNTYPYDQVHIGTEWWALGLLGTLHVHLGPVVTLDGAVGYGPYGYFAANYWDDYGLVGGPVQQTSTVFPQNAWGLDWSAGLSLGFFEDLAFQVGLGMTGPDFLAGLGVGFSL